MRIPTNDYNNGVIPQPLLPAPRSALEHGHSFHILVNICSIESWTATHMQNCAAPEDVAAQATITNLIKH